MKVTSGLADVDFSVHSVSRQGPYLVVRDEDRGATVPTVVYVSPQDIVALLRAVLVSPSALGFVLSAPFRRRAALPESPVAGSTWRDDVNNPWL